MSQRTPNRREVLLLKAMEGTLSDAERLELGVLAPGDPALGELLQIPEAELEERIRADDSLEPKGLGRRVQRTGVALVALGWLGLILAPLGVPPLLAGGLVLGGGALAIVPWLEKRVKKSDPYGKVDR